MAFLNLFLRPLFELLNLFMKSTIIRLLLTLSLLPIYLAKQAKVALPTVLLNFPSLLTRRGRYSLVQNAREQRQCERKLASEQNSGEFKFPAESFCPWDHISPWPNHLFRNSEVKAVPVCGINARVFHSSPTSASKRKRHPDPRQSVVFHHLPQYHPSHDFRRLFHLCPRFPWPRHLRQAIRTFSNHTRASYTYPPPCHRSF